MFLRKKVGISFQTFLAMQTLVIGLSPSALANNERFSNTMNQQVQASLIQHQGNDALRQISQFLEAGILLNLPELDEATAGQIFMSVVEGNFAQALNSLQRLTQYLDRDDAGGAQGAVVAHPPAVPVAGQAGAADPQPRAQGIAWENPTGMRHSVSELVAKTKLQFQDHLVNWYLDRVRLLRPELGENENGLVPQLEGHRREAARDFCANSVENGTIARVDYEKCVKRFSEETEELSAASVLDLVNVIRQTAALNQPVAAVVEAAAGEVEAQNDVGADHGDDDDDLYAPDPVPVVPAAAGAQTVVAPQAGAVDGVQQQGEVVHEVADAKDDADMVEEIPIEDLRQEVALLMGVHAERIANRNRDWLEARKAVLKRVQQLPNQKID